MPPRVADDGLEIVVLEESVEGSEVDTALGGGGHRRTQFPRLANSTSLARRDQKAGHKSTSERLRREKHRAFVALNCIDKSRTGRKLMRLRSIPLYCRRSLDPTVCQPDHLPRSRPSLPLPPLYVGGPLSVLARFSSGPKRSVRARTISPGQRRSQVSEKYESSPASGPVGAARFFPASSSLRLLGGPPPPSETNESYKRPRPFTIIFTGAEGGAESFGVGGLEDVTPRDAAGPVGGAGVEFAEFGAVESEAMYRR